MPPGRERPRSRVPKTRPEVVSRHALLARLEAAEEPLITVVGPAGYGKTTVLGQWVRDKQTPVAWVSCEESDNDPAAFWGTVIAELAEVSDLDPEAYELVAASGGGVTTVPSLVSVLSRLDAPITLVVDHVEALTSQECRTSLAEFAL